MRNKFALKRAVQFVKNYVNQRSWKSNATYHQRCAEIGLEAISTMGKPTAVMLTFWPGDAHSGEAPSKIFRELESKFLKHPCKNSQHKITIQWVREKREPTPSMHGLPGIPGGWHYHAMVVMDFSKVSMKYLIKIVNDMKHEGYFHKYWLSRVNGSRDDKALVQLHDLRSDKGWAEYLGHAEYLAKERTKVKTEGRRNSNGSQVTRLPEWFKQLLPGGTLDNVPVPAGSLAW
ncbi:hypothetical protein [uncultured Aquitalea sp.]|uniref:hypothetical protein n=1 Tax=uncultured Aquitalea sp. TaxID=540272 RepID=UPI0025E9FD9F|nr:hypothetical protein [uncultured Aquitalea sp.]